MEEEKEQIITMLEKERKRLSSIGPKDDPKDPDNTAMSRGFIVGIELLSGMLEDFGLEEIVQAIEEFLESTI